jgi:hypothetical protein
LQHTATHCNTLQHAGTEAEEHRSRMTELNNRIDYYDLVMQERETAYQVGLFGIFFEDFSIIALIIMIS